MGGSGGGSGGAQSTSRRGSLYTANNSPLSRLCGESRDVGEAVMIRREKRGSLSSSPMMNSLSHPEAAPGNIQRGRSQSYVETIDTNRKVNITKTTTHSSYLNPPLSQGLRTDLKDLAEDDGESRRGGTNKCSRAGAPHQMDQQGHGGLSICTAIRDFIIHSIRS